MFGMLQLIIGIELVSHIIAFVFSLLVVFSALLLLFYFLDNAKATNLWSFYLSKVYVVLLYWVGACS